MNNIFKTIWNKSTQSWVAVSELARGYVKSSSDKTSSRSAKIGSSKFNLSFITLSILISTSPEIVAIDYTPTYGVITGGNHNIAIGTNSKTGEKSTNQSIAIGSGNAKGNGAWAKGDQSIAIGGNTIAEGHSSIVIGGDDVDKAINENINYTNDAGNSITGKLGVAYTSLTGGNLLEPSQYTSSTSGHLGVALGVKAVASNLSLALGTNAQASKTNTLAIGAGAIAKLDNSVAIGGGASTEGSSGTKQQNTTIEGTLFSWAGGDNVLKGDIVTFGKKGFERQLKNIAPGEVSETSTDAINGSQLYSITQVLTKRSQRDVYVHVNTGDSKQEKGNSTTNAGHIDAKGGATGTKSATLGVNATATAENAIAIGTGASAINKNSVALGQGATTSAVAIDNLIIPFKDATYNNKTVTVSGQGNEEKGSISFGSQGKERQLQNVAAGRITETSTDAINGSQLYHVAKNLGFNVYQGNSSKARINNDGVVKFEDGQHSTAVVTTENGNAKVTFNVKTSTITATDLDITATGNELVKANDVVAAIKNTSFNVETDGSKTGNGKIKHGNTLNINQGEGISINRNNTTFTIGLDKNTKDKLNKIATGVVAENNENTVTGGAVKTAINEAVNNINNTIDTLNLSFEGNNAATGKVILKNGTFKIKGEGPIETTSTENQDTLTVKIKNSSIENKHLADNAITSDKIAPNAVTTNKIADGNVTLPKLGSDVVNTINAKEESVDASSDAQAAGLTVTDRAVEGKGKAFTINLNKDTLIHKLSEGSNITAPANALITDTTLKSYLDNNPIKLLANKSDLPETNNKISLGGTLSIKGKDGGLIETNVRGSNFTLDLTQTTKEQLAKIGTGDVQDGNQNTVTGDKVYDAIAKSGFWLNVNEEADGTGENINPNDTVRIKRGDNITVSREKNNITISTVDSPTFKDIALKVSDTANPIKLTSDSEGKNITLSGGAGGNESVKLNGVADGTVDNGSKEAVTGNQLKDLADKLGVGLNANKTAFDSPTFKNITNKNGTNGANPISFKDALDKLTDSLNQGLTFGGDIGVAAKQYLGSKFDVKAATETIDTKFVGTNLKTSYTKNADGNGTLSIGLSENPEFKSVVFKNGNNQVTVTPTENGLSFSKNTPIGTENSVKLTNLADGDLSPNSKDAVTGKQLHEVKSTLESGWNIGNTAGSVTAIKPTNNVNFIASDSVEVIVSKIETNGKVTGANVTFNAKTTDISVNTTTGTVAEVAEPNKLVTAKNVSQALKTIGWQVTADKDTDGILESGASTIEKVASGDKVTFKAGKNLKIKQDGKNFTYSTADTVDFTKVTATDSISITNGPALSTTGLDMTNKKISNLADGEITATSKEAITGSQLKDLADKLGITSNNTKFETPAFTNAINNPNGSTITAPKNLKEAIENIVTTLNKGLTFGGDKGTADTQYLGSKFDIKATTTLIDSKFAGKNLQTSYEKNTDGNGVLSIGLSETPDFKKITLTDGNENNVQPYLTLEKDGANNGGKITGLSERDATKNPDYGINDNVNRAATEGAVKEISDRIKQSDNTSPFTYVDENGNPVTKAADGKFYPKNLVNADGTPKAEANGKGIDPSNVVIKTKNDTPLPITNVRSGLGLDGKAEDNAVEGTSSNPKTIGADKAQKIIAGNNKDGNGGLLTKEGADLNKVATIGDLQALAQAGLDFSGNKGDVIHRPLGTKLEILGKDNVNDLIGYSSENIATETTADNKLYIRFREKPEFKGITVKDTDDKHHIELTADNGLVVKANKYDNTPVKITSSGIDAGDNKIANISDGDISDGSKEAVTGNQLSDLAKKLGVDTNGTSFTAPDFTPLKNKTGADNTKPTTFKNVLEQLTTTLNNGLTFGADLGTATKQYLGSKFDVKATTDDISDNGKTFAGKNLKTKYVNSNGDGILSIGLSETPDFKKITLTDGGNNANPYLTLEKDGMGDSGKITGLTHRDPTKDVDDYGKNGNEGRAATEGAVKELSDRVNQGDKNSPFVYEKADGTKIKKAADGKFYPESLVNADGTTKDGASAQEVKPEDVVVKVNDNTPMPITNVKSGLGLDGKSDTDPTTGSQSEPKAISADKAKTAIAGKDGKSGLLSKEGADLNKVSTIGDLQALAQAGLDFAGNKGTVIHRPLGTKLEILGNASIKDDELAKFSTDNIVTETKDDKLYIKFKDIPKLKGLELNSGNPNAKSVTISSDDTGSKLTLSGGDNSDVQLDGLQKGQITDTSKNAVTGNQLKDLADKLGVDVNDEKTGFKMPEFTAIKGKDGKDAADTDKPKNLRDAVNKTIEAVNRGLNFAGDEGKGNQNLGSKLNINSTTSKITTADGKTFVGKNITTKYEKDPNTGDGTLSIGISERPDFEAITLTKDGEKTPFLTIGEDTDNTDKPTTGKITGLTARNLDSDKYGVGDNVGRAATEGAVKDLYDKVKSNEGSSPFEYRDTDNNKLVKVGDKYYSEKDLEGKHIVDGKIFDKPVVKDGDKYYEIGPDGKRKLGPDGQPLATEASTANITEKEPATASNKKLTDISNVASGLGLPGTYTKDPADSGSKELPKAITEDAARKAIAGDDKDGKGGLYTKEGKDLNKVATIGDLQAVAKAGLTFKGNNTDAEVHRPLGTTLDIKGEATDAAGTSGKNVYVEASAKDNSLTVKIKETPEFKGLELKDQNANSIKFTPSDADSKDNPGQKEPVLTLSSGTGPNNTVKLTGISDGDISPTSKDAVNGSQVFALSRGEIPKIEDKQIIITQPDGSTTVIDAKNVIVDEKGNPLLKTYNVQGQGEHIENSVISAISNMNTEGIKFFHTNDGRNVDDRPKVQGLNDEDSSAGGVHSTAVGYRANAAGENGVAFGPDAVAGKILEEKEVTITERVNGKEVVTKRKVRVVEGVKNAIAIGAGARASNDNTISIGSGNQVNGKNSGAIGDPSYINADNAYAIGNNNKIEKTSEKTFVLGNDVTVTTARSVFLGDAVGYVAADNKAGTTKGNAEYSEQKIGETTYKYAGGKANEVVGVVSVGNVKQDGTMETRRIQNVAPGLISDKSTDAINGSQLYAVMDSGWNLKAEEVDGTSGKVTKGKADTTKVSIGKTVKVRAGNNVEIAHNKDESIDISTSMAPTFNSLNVNPGGTVNMGGNRVQNVGNAVEAGDAVNYGQFKAEVGKLDSRLQAGIAGAVASGTLVQAFNPNESLVAVGAGTYRGKSAVALGYSRVSDNGKIIIKVTGSTNTYGDVTGGASVGYKF